MSVVDDAWVCRIPRELLLSLAADPRLRDRERMLVALLAAIHSEGKHPGEGPASLVDLERVTTMHRRSVRRVLKELINDQVLVATPSTKGRLWRLQGAHPLRTARRLRTPEAESAHPSDQKRAQESAHPLRTEVGANGAHPRNEEEEKNSLKNGEQAPHENGFGPVPSEEQRAVIAAKTRALAARYSMGHPPQPVYEQQPPERDPDEPDPDEQPAPDPDELATTISEGSK